MWKLSNIISKSLKIADKANRGLDWFFTYFLLSTYLWVICNSFHLLTQWGWEEIPDIQTYMIWTVFQVWYIDSKCTTTKKDLTNIIKFVRQKKARFDKKMSGSTQKCPTQHASVDRAMIKYPPPSLLKLFSNIIQTFCGVSYTLSTKWQSCYLQNFSEKNHIFIARCCRSDRYRYVQCCKAVTDHYDVSLGTMRSRWQRRHY